MHVNLRNAMSSKNITVVAISQLIGTTEKTVQNKMKGVTDFTVQEAMIIKTNLFPEYDLCYLFTKNDLVS